MRYEQHFPSFSHFAHLFHEPLKVNETTTKYEKRGNIVPGNHAITFLRLA